MLGGSPPQRTASGDQSAMEPPGPIPNPEVKRCRADGSWAKGPARVGRCQLYARLFRKKKPGVFFTTSPAPVPGGEASYFRNRSRVPGGLSATVSLSERGWSFIEAPDERVFFLCFWSYHSSGF